MLKSLSFEAKMLCVSCVFVLIRMVDPLIRYIQQGLPPDFIILSVLISVVSLSVLTLTLIGIRSRVITISFSFLLIFVITFYWISRDGLVSTSDINYIGLLTLLAAINSKKELKIALIASYLIIVIVVFAWLLNFEWLIAFDKLPVYEVYKYQFLIILFSLFMIIWVFQFNNDKESTEGKSLLISAKIKELARENEELERQQVELEKATNRLEHLVQERKEKLLNSNAQISSFLDVNSNKIAPTVEGLLEEIKSTENLNHELAYSDWLHRSAQKLNEAFVSVKLSHTKWTRNE